MIRMADGDSVLLVSTATRGYDTARVPRALAKAGFDVTLLTPRNSLAEHSRHVSRVAYLPESATPLQWIHAFAGVVKAVAPVQAIPCDDTAFRLMAALALSPPAQLRTDLHSELAQLIRESLGDPAHYRESVDEALLPAAAERAGVRVPAYAAVTTIEEAGRFAELRGYPVVVKRPQSSAGDGVRIVADRAALASAMTALAAPNRADLEPDASRRVLIQQFIKGHVRYQNVAAWKGRTLAGYAGDRLQAHGDVKSHATVIRQCDSPELREFSRRLVEAFGMSGLFGCEYLVEEGTGTQYLVEINRRITPATHYGAVLGVDLCAALRAAMRGEPSTTRTGLDPGEERIQVTFPGEWLRDPASPWLRTHPVDVPWDDPGLLDAMLALRKEAWKA
jgi:predicted ATP-grasp superfamily ATP-dependent carboligase